MRLKVAKPPQRQIGGGPRGDVVVFSRQSRRSLMRLVATTGAPPAWFLTLTYQGWPTWAEAKADLKVWSQAFERVCNRAGLRVALVWRAELTKEGRPHFHLLVWQSGQQRSLLTERLHRQARPVGERVVRRVRRPGKRARRRASLRWSDMVGAATALWLSRSRLRGGDASDLERRCVDVKTIRSEKQAVAYCAKYVAKVGKIPQIAQELGAGAVVGRHWGRSGDKEILAPKVWARMEVPNDGTRIDGVAQTLAEAGRPVAALLVADRVSQVFCFGLGDVLSDLWTRLSLWAVPSTRPPPGHCLHPRCVGERSLELVWA